MGYAITTVEMVAVMRRYVTTYHLAENPAIHVYVASTQTRQAWGVRRWPTWAIVNARVRVMPIQPGAVTTLLRRSLG